MERRNRIKVVYVLFLKFIFLFPGFISYAQEAGIEVHYGKSTYKSEINTGWVTNPRIGLFAGFDFLSRNEALAGIYYSRKGSEFKLHNIYYEGTITTNYIEIPIRYSFNVFNNLYLGTNICSNFFLSGEEISVQGAGGYVSTQKIEIDNYRKIYFSAGLHLKYKIKHKGNYCTNIGLNYQYGLQTVSDKSLYPLRPQEVSIFISFSKNFKSHAVN